MDGDLDPREDDDADAQVQRLLRFAGARAEPDVERKERHKSNLKDVWRREVALRRSRRLRKAGITFAMAASVLIVLIGTVRITRPPQPIALAHVIYSSGEFAIASSSTASSETDQALFEGDLLVTPADGSASIQLTDESVIQLDVATQITIQGPSEFWLHHGRVFFDAPGSARSIIVRTAWGTIKDIGTQFEVAVDAQVLEIAMREGQVELILDAVNRAPILASADENQGDFLMVEQDLSVSRETIGRTSQRWAWINAGAPAFPAGEHTLSTIVRWAARQTGRRLVFDTPLTELQVANISVTWPDIVVAEVESSLLELADSIDHPITVTSSEIRVSRNR